MGNITTITVSHYSFYALVLHLKKILNPARFTQLDYFFAVLNYMMKKIILFVGLITITSLLSSCGVMFGGSKYNENIKVLEHPKAEIFANGEKIGVGEVTKSFKRNNDLKIEVKQDGCEPKTQNFPNIFRTGNFILSVVSWGIPGIVVDLASGAAYKPDHKDNNSVEKISTKEFNFNIDYSEYKL